MPGPVGIDPIILEDINGVGLVKDPNDRGLYPQKKYWTILDKQYNQDDSLDSNQQTRV